MTGSRLSAFALLIAVGPLAAATPARQSAGANPRGRHPAAFDTLFADLARDSARDIKGVLVTQDDNVVAEAYFNGDDSSTLHDIRSATKSITALLVGIAIDRHLIENEHESVGTILGLPSLRGIALDNVLTMRSGLDDDDRDTSAAGNEARLDQSNDWLRFASHVPLTSAPGVRHVYSSLNAFLAGAIVERASHRSLAEFANAVLFQPVGIRRFAWQRGPRGEGSGQGNLSITLRDMGRIGTLALHRGAVGQHQVVSAGWMDRAFSPLVPIGSVDPYADWYGYMWYQRSYVMAGRPVLVHFASGNGGNKIYIVPAERLVVAISSSAYNTSYGQRRSESTFRRVLGAVIPGRSEHRIN